MIFNNPFNIKIISKLRLEGNVLNLIKSIYENPTATSTQYGEISNALPLRPGTKQGRTLSPLIFNTAPSVRASTIMQEKKIFNIRKEKKNCHDSKM